MSTLVEESDIAGVDGRAKVARNRMSRGGYQTGCLFIAVPPETHMEPLLYRDFGTSCFSIRFAAFSFIVGCNGSSNTTARLILLKPCSII